MQNLSRKHWSSFYAIGLGLLFLTTLQLFGIHQSLKVSVLDVGQGDAILIQTPEYHNILIDTGPDSKVVDRLGEQLGFFDKTIGLFILTHPDRDHYAGILDVMQKYEINKILLTGIYMEDPLYLAFLEEAQAEGIGLIFIQNHQDLQISPNLYLDVLYPFEGQSLVGQKVKNRNNTSIVSRLVRRSSDGWETLMMLAGDAESGQEREVLLSGQAVKGDVLKLGHHGSKSSTSLAFLAAVDPTVAVVSAGKDNSFGHPHPETLERVKDLEVRQTLEDGTIELNF